VIFYLIGRVRPEFVKENREAQNAWASPGNHPNFRIIGNTAFSIFKRI
jgi:hypothetical protein